MERTERVPHFHSLDGGYEIDSMQTENSTNDLHRSNAAQKCEKVWTLPWFQINYAAYHMAFACIRNSPPEVYKNVIIRGAVVQESPTLGPSGNTRGWDAITGKLIYR